MGCRCSKSIAHTCVQLTKEMSIFLSLSLSRVYIFSVVNSNNIFPRQFFDVAHIQSRIIGRRVARRPICTSRRRIMDCYGFICPKSRLPPGRVRETERKREGGSCKADGSEKSKRCKWSARPGTGTRAIFKFRNGRVSLRTPRRFMRKAWLYVVRDNKIRIDAVSRSRIVGCSIMYPNKTEWFCIFDRRTSLSPSLSLFLSPRGRKIYLAHTATRGLATVASTTTSAEDGNIDGWNRCK